MGGRDDIFGAFRCWFPNAGCEEDAWPPDRPAVGPPVFPPVPGAGKGFPLTY